MVIAFYNNKKFLGTIHRYTWGYDEAEAVAKKRLDLYKADSYEVYLDDMWETLKTAKLIKYGTLDSKR